MSETILRDQRKFRRFELKLPLEVVRTGSSRLSHPGETRNVSSGGVLFIVRSQLEIGQPIEYFITLLNAFGADVRLHCRGKVVRLEQPVAVPVNGESPIAVAATLERYEFVRQTVRIPALSTA